MREFMRVFRTYLSPYKSYLGGAVVLNILSAVFNIFSFSFLVPMLQILFKMDTTVYSFIAWDTPDMSLTDKAMNNAYWYIGTLMANHGAMWTLLAMCLMMALLTAVKTGCYFGSSAVMIPIRTGIVKDLRMKIYDKILGLPLGFFSEERKGDIIARISGDVQEVETSITSSIDLLFKDPILILFYFASLLVLSPELTLFTVIFLPGFMWVMGVIAKKLKRRSKEAQALLSDTMSLVEETLGGLRVVKAFNAESKMSSRFGHVTDAMRRKNNRVAMRQALAHPVSEFLGTVMLLIVLSFGGFMIIRGKGLFGENFMDAPTFIYFMVILYSIIAPIKELSRAAYGIPRGLASIERINVILDAEATVPEPENPLPLDGFNDCISFRHVDFSYDNGRQILHDINLDIRKGTTVAIVGESGSGKSTLVDLISRFYDVTAGSVTIDGKDVRTVDVHALRALIGNVNQDPILFNDTIFNNIAFGAEKADMDDVAAAARTANAHEFIMEKAEGYGTGAGDRGCKLSGGQRQRVSIARAILKNPPILILDEATAALDTESERMVQEALDRLVSTRTVIAIAHRLSTVKNADEIIVLHEGRIAERGRHDDLIRANGYYKRLYDMQIA